ncbi:hypothetical protein AB0A81_29245 [Streptomyces flaveolus]|uniref:Uncharacterized protein n=1 Tax=Streptomyces flaveolus TaxID=67297 RepID=A0ABV1VJS0_9ACTN
MPTAAAPPPAAGHPRDLAELPAGCVDDPARVSVDAPRRVAPAHDASPYLFTPQAVVRAATAAEVGALMAGARPRACP